MESLCLLFLLSSPLAFTKWALVQVGKNVGQEDKGSPSPSSPSSTKLTKFKMSHGEKYGEEDKSFATESGTWERDEDYQEFSDDQDGTNDKRHIRTRAMVTSHLKWSSSK